MTIYEALKIVARKKPVVVVALSLAVVNMVATSIIQSTMIIQSSPLYAEKIIKPRTKLIIDKNCTANCTRQCTVIIKTSNEALRVPLTIIPQEIKLKGTPKLGEGEISIGYTLLQYGLKRGMNTTIILNAQNYNVTIKGIHHTGSILDLGIIARAGFPQCNDVLYRLGSEGVEPFTNRFSEQVQDLVENWWLASLLLLAVGTLVASQKAFIDLGEDVENLYAEGASKFSIPYAYAIFLVIALLGGYAWGLILSDTINDIVATYTGLYIPRPNLTIETLMLYGILPTILLGFIGLATGLVNAVNTRKLHV